MRVGFIVTAHSWLGGRNYFRNLLSALQSLPTGVIDPVVITGKGRTVLFDDFPETEVLRTRVVEEWTFPWVLRKSVTTVSSRDWILRRLLEQNRISVLSHSSHLGLGSPISTVGWIPDFQHVHFPEFFTKKERNLLDVRLLRMCTMCDGIIVSSKSAEADLRSFAGRYADKAAVLKFVSALHDKATPLEELRRKYSIDRPYFVLPNQFWAHKNHRVVIDALRILSQKGRDALVLATGPTHDLRQGGFFQTIENHVRETETQEKFRILGVISSSDLAGLMRNAVAFINPSRFEGWSTSVEEAKSIGKSILLSSIPVHREQSPERGQYFDSEDAVSLADLISKAQESFDETYDAEMQAQARDRLPGRQRQFAETFLKIVQRAEKRPSDQLV